MTHLLILCLSGPKAFAFSAELGRKTDLYQDRLVRAQLCAKGGHHTNHSSPTVDDFGGQSRKRHRVCIDRKFEPRFSTCACEGRTHDARMRAGQVMVVVKKGYIGLTDVNAMPHWQNNSWLRRSRLLPELGKSDALNPTGTNKSNL